MLAAEYIGDQQFRTTERSATPPGPGQVQIKVAYVGICGTDLHIKHGAMDSRVQIPAVIGHEMSGTVTATGPDVQAFRPDDHVTVMPLEWCGHCPACATGHQHVCQNLVFVGIDSPGAMQQFWNVNEQILVSLPPDLPLVEATLSEPLAVAVHDVARADVQTGEKVLVVGGGPIGLLIALVATAEGADVLISEPNEYRRHVAERMDLRAIDPTVVELDAQISDWTDSAGVDVAFEVSGAPQGLTSATHAIRVRGRLVIVAIHSHPVPVDLFRVFWRELKILGARVYTRRDFERAVKLLASGQIPATQLISTVEPLAQVTTAFEALESGDGVVKVLLDCQG